MEHPEPVGIQTQTPDKYRNSRMDDEWPYRNGTRNSYRTAVGRIHPVYTNTQYAYTQKDFFFAYIYIRNFVLEPVQVG